MLRVGTGLAVALLTGLVTAGSAAAGDATTTRIEPRGFYGATITVESGVRVFRPLPRTERVIVNPNSTPLKLTFKETRHVYEAPRQTHDHHMTSLDSYSRHVRGFPINGLRHHGKRFRRAPTGH